MLSILGFAVGDRVITPFRTDNPGHVEWNQGMKRGRIAGCF